MREERERLSKERERKEGEGGRKSYIGKSGHAEVRSIIEAVRENLDVLDTLREMGRI